VEHGADVNKISNLGMTSLSIFYKNGDEVIIKYLVEFV